MNAKIAVTITATGDTRKQLSGSDGGFVFNPLAVSDRWFFIPCRLKRT
jgi:phage pi2 protein 07